jgi:RNA polymerase sigma factor (sigma-70 family)
VKGDRQRRRSIRGQDADLGRIADDPDAFEDFYRDHLENVQRFVARRVADPYLAADLTADVFLAAIESAHSYRPGRVAPIAWLYGIARNVVAGERRRSGRESQAQRRVPPSAELIEPDDLARLHERIDAYAASRSLYRAMERLSDGERAVLELVALEELSVSEAARALDIRPVAARARLYRARRLLQTKLGPGVTESTPRLSEASR